eukprot:674820-Pelagomonas_calceolata.AAC.2
MSWGGGGRKLRAGQKKEECMLQKTKTLLSVVPFMVAIAALPPFFMASDTWVGSPDYSTCWLYEGSLLSAWKCELIFAQARVASIHPSAHFYG